MTFKISIIMGSIREGRINPRIAAWTAGQLETHGFAPDLVDPADPALLPLQTGEPAAAAHLRQRLAGADGIVIVTPEFNHSFPGALKSLLDACKTELHACPVGLISYGGISGGLRATEALRVVLAELHAVTIRDTISFAAPWGKFAEDGQIPDPDQAHKAVTAMETFAHRLHWWAQSLTEARTARPYLPEVK